MKQEAWQCPFNTDQGTGSCVGTIEGKGTLLCKRMELEWYSLTEIEQLKIKI